MYFHRKRASDFESITRSHNENTHKCIQENATSPQSQEEYLERYNSLAEKYEETVAKINEQETERALRNGRAEGFERFIRMFEIIKGNLIEFDDEVWLQSIELVKVQKNGQLTFIFQGGTEIEVFVGMQLHLCLS